MNRCGVCGRKIQNTETNDGIAVCKICLGYEEQILEKDREIERLRNCIMTEEQVKQIMQEGMHKTMMEQFENGVYDKQLKSLAIEELKKLKKEKFEGKCRIQFDVARNEYIINQRDKELIDYIDERIKELENGNDK